MAGAQLYGLDFPHGVAVHHSQCSDRVGLVYQDSDGPVSRCEDVPQGSAISSEGTVAGPDGARPRLALNTSFSTRRLIAEFVNAASFHHQPSDCIACAAAMKRLEISWKSASLRSWLKMNRPVPIQLSISPSARR